MHDQLSLVDEAALTGEPRMLLVRMVELVARINWLAMSDPQQWDGPIYGPSVAADAPSESHYAMGLHRGRLQELREQYWSLTRRDWTRDFEALKGWRVNQEGRFTVRPVRFDHSSIVPQPVW